MKQPGPSISRRTFSLLTLATAATPLLPRAYAAGRPSRVLIGTSGSVSKGIYSSDWNAETGELGTPALAAELVAPTFFALHPKRDRTLLFSVSEGDANTSGVSSLSTVPDSVQLKTLSRVSSQGDGPTHLSCSPDGRSVVVANYGSGSVSSYHVHDDGTLSEAVSHFQYSGHGPYSERQEGPHAHSAQISPDGRCVLVNDLGLDRICIYRLRRKTAELTPAQPAVWNARPGSGPRHIAFHPNHRWVYSVNELDSTVDQLAWHPTNGTLTHVSTVSTLPPDFPPHTAFAGEILISADGRHLYVGNRIASDTIAVFDIDPVSGALKLKQLAGNGGKLTRHISLDPTGRWMLAANQASAEVVVLRRDADTGLLSAPVHRCGLDTPMFTAFL